MTNSVTPQKDGTPIARDTSKEGETTQDTLISTDRNNISFLTLARNSYNER